MASPVLPVLFFLNDRAAQERIDFALHDRATVVPDIDIAGQLNKGRAKRLSPFALALAVLDTPEAGIDVFKLADEFRKFWREFFKVTDHGFNRDALAIDVGKLGGI